MRFLLDMNLPRPLADWSRQEGHDAVHLRDLGGAEWTDREIFASAAETNRIVVTFDLDFGEIVGLSPASTGVLLFRLRLAGQPYLRQRLAVAITEAAAALQDGAIVLVEDARIRIRRVPERNDPA
jgi:predicted nuclease of predicted toxin-antitoxin system